MTYDEDIAYEMNRELGQAEAREIDRRVEHALTHCPEHDQTLPCTNCSGDHLAGAHLFGSHEATCARCAVPTLTVPHTQLDAQQIAAGDDTLEPEETR